MSVILSLSTDSPDATRSVGAVLGAHFVPGDVVALAGELGAGKTCLVQGMAVGLGIEAHVTSPTFVLVRQHADGRMPLVHVDVYRLNHLSDIEGLGDDVLAPDAVTVIEWGDTVDALLPDTRLLIDIAHEGDGDERRIVLTGTAAWQERVTTWLEALAELDGVTTLGASSASEGG